MGAEMAARPGVQFIAGGATQNSIRVAQWMLQQPGATAYMGCVGKDEFADKMKASCDKDGVQTSYMVDAKTPTGSCAVLVEGIERSLCTNLMAANNFKLDHVQEAGNLKVLQQAKIVYSAGFFITVSMDSMRFAALEAEKSGAKYCLNLSAPFLMQVPPFKAFILEILPSVDFLFLQRDGGRNIRGDRGLGNHRHWLHCNPPFSCSQLEGSETHCCDHPGQGSNDRSSQRSCNRVCYHRLAQGEACGHQRCGRRLCGRFLGSPL